MRIACHRGRYFPLDPPATERSPRLAALLAAALLTGPAAAYQRYQDGCDACHNWTANPYSSPKGGTWPSSAHIVHRNNSYMGTDCDVCHTTGDGNNPYLGSSDLDAYDTSPGDGCAGCHGTLFAGVSRGYGLRLHHEAHGVTCTGACHTAGTPAAESTMPLNYGGSLTNADDPCNAPLATLEDWSGDNEGLDNDGDDLYDQSDPDCGGCRDADGDTYSPDGAACGAVDCNDGNSTIYPGATETCNGQDDDCDTQTDEGFGLGAPCDGSDTDLCQEGSVTCAGCNDATGNSVETCNGQDDDCDTQTDEGFGLGAPCDGPDADLCAEGAVTCSGCNDATGDSVETCNGLDDDCDTQIDEGCPCAPGDLQACGTDEGECVAGTQTCQAGGAWGPCSGTGSAPETCDGLDNNCDTQTDEGFGLGVPCDGLDGDLCQEGVVTCAGCDDATGDTAEVCNGADDDCDTQTDEGFDVGTLCDGVDADLCQEGAVTCAGCDDVTGDTVDICNGADDDCDTQTDEDFGVGLPCDGTDADLCEEGVVTCAGCDDATGDAVEVCNGADDNCDTQTDEGFVLGGPCDGPDADLCPEGVTTCAGCDDTTGDNVEVCNGADDDCDTQTDEDFGVGLPCDGTDADLCEEGVVTCAGCDDATGDAVEACNGADDDCDGITDEDFGLGDPCDGPDADLCEEGATTCAGCDDTTGDASEACNGADDDCDGQTDEGCETEPDGGGEDGTGDQDGGLADEQGGADSAGAGGCSCRLATSSKSPAGALLSLALFVLARRPRRPRQRGGRVEPSRGLVA